MNKSVVSQYQPSFTEWFAAIGETKVSNALREEDNGKNQRLEILFQQLGLLYERPVRHEAKDFFELNSKVKDILNTRGNELCAMRLVPKRAGLPKLRNRGLSIQECYNTWLVKQAVEPDSYWLELCPHSDRLLWSSIFVVNSEAVFGEIIEGLHSQLTQGETTNQPYRFYYDFNDWQWSENNSDAARLAEDALEMLKVTKEQKVALVDGFQADFSHGYLAGYFETTVWPDNKIRFIDYNRLLPKFIPTPKLSRPESGDGILAGVTAYPGNVQGKVVIVTEENMQSVRFDQGDILVCDNTDVRYLPYMRQAGAIVTNRGGILSHAAIVARELKKPCLIGTQSATHFLQTGGQVEVDAEHGIVRKL